MTLLTVLLAFLFVVYLLAYALVDEAAVRSEELVRQRDADRRSQAAHLAAFRRDSTP